MSIKKWLTLFAVILSVSTVPLHAEEAPAQTAWEAIQQTASNVADKTREVATDVADRTREIAGNTAERTRAVLGDAADRGQEVGEDISNSKAWKKTKEVGNATAEAAKNGVHKAKGYVNSHACDKKDKLNCEAE